MIENSTTNTLSTASKVVILMSMSARHGENLKKQQRKQLEKKKFETEATERLAVSPAFRNANHRIPSFFSTLEFYILLIIQTNTGFASTNSRSSKFLLLKEVRRIRIPLDNNTERHKITRNIGI